MRAGLVVYHGERHGEVREVNAAALEHARSLAGVAGHVGGEEGLAYEREVVVEGDARLRRAAGADVGGEAEALGHVDVEGLELLVDVADDELGQGLERYRDEVREAGHEERREHLVHGHHPVRKRAAAETAVVREDEGYLLRQALHYGVHMQVGNLQRGAAVALEEAVDEGEGAEVGAHPAVLPHALEDGQRGARDHEAHALEVVEPGEIVGEGVVHTAPLAVFRYAGLVMVAAAQAALAVLGLPQGVELLQLLINESGDGVFHRLASFAWMCLISRLSTKAWKRVRSWPMLPRAYSFSMVQQGTPSSFCSTCEARTFS